MNRKITILFLIIVLVGGCKKYPEDPGTIHLRTAKKRLVRQIWITDRVINKNTGVNYSGSPGNDIIIFDKNGNFNGENAEFFKFNGEWEFEDKKNNLHIYNDAKSFTFKIMRLDAYFLHFKNDSIDCNYH